MFRRLAGSPRATEKDGAAAQHRHRRVARVSGAAAALAGVYLLLAYVVLPWLWWFAERGQHPALDGLPKVTRNADGIPGDPINVGLVGPRRS